MNAPMPKRLAYGWLLLLALVIVSCGGPGSTTVTPTFTATLPNGQVKVGSVSPAITNVAQQVLQNIRQHGWNPAAQTHGQTTGGLFINWKMDNPSMTNNVRVGSSGTTTTDHDPQVDLLYLNALVLYQKSHPDDHSQDSEVQRALTLVLADFQKYNLPKGWIYFYLLRDGLLLNNSDLLNEARTVASNYYQNWYDPREGAVYNRAHTPGDYNVEHTLNCGAALIDAGLRWKQPTWVQAGQSTIDHTISVALDPQYHLFYASMTVPGNGPDQVQNYQAKPSTEGNAVEALVNAYNLTHRQNYLDVAGQVLQSMFGASGLWDQTNGGLYFALDMSKNKLSKDYKETRGQTLSLIGLYHYNETLAHLGQQQQLTDKEQQLITLLTNNFYQPTYHGYFYRMTPTFQVYVSRPGTGIGVEDYFTTEAMGTALDALQQTEFAQMY